MKLLERHLQVRQRGQVLVVAVIGRAQFSRQLVPLLLQQVILGLQRFGVLIRANADDDSKQERRKMSQHCSGELPVRVRFLWDNNNYKRVSTQLAGMVMGFFFSCAQRKSTAKQWAPSVSDVGRTYAFTYAKLQLLYGVMTFPKVGSRVMTRLPARYNGFADKSGKKVAQSLNLEHFFPK